MSTEPEQFTGFSRFVQEVKSFEKTLYGLIASSFVFSGITSIANAQQFKDDPSFAAMTLLVGTIGGIAGVLVTYVGWWRHPIDEFTEVMRFRAAKFALPLGFGFLASVGGIYAYYDLSRLDRLGSLVALPIGTFFFFRALVTGFLVAREMERQQRTWHAMTPDQRVAWLRREHEQREIHERSKRLLEESKQLRAEADRVIRAADKTIRDIRWKSIKSKIRVILRMFYSASINLRVAIAGDAFLTWRERLNRKVERRDAEERLKELYRENAQKAYAEIKDGRLQPLQIEGTAIEVYPREAWHYFLVRASLDEAAARKLVDALARFRDAETRKFRLLVGFVEDHVDVSVQARDCLKAEGISLWQTSNWHAV